MYYRFRKLYISLISLLPLLFFNDLSFASKPIHVRLQLKWYHQFQFAGYYAAQKKGYYRNEGLDVEFFEGSPRNPPVQNVLDGKANFGVSGSDILNHFISKEPVVVLSVIFQHSPYVFMTLPEKHITSASDLAGKRIMASNDQGWLLFKALLLREGIPLDSIQLVPHSWNNMDLVNNKVDAMSAYSTVEPEQLRLQGYKVNLIRPIDYGIDFYGDLLFTTKEEIEKHPKVVEGFNHASLKGWEYAMNHPTEIANYILQMPGVKERGITKESLLFEAAEMRKLIMPELVEIGHINPGRWQNMLNVYSELGLAEKNTNLQGFLYESIEIGRMKLFDTLIIAISIGLFLFLVALVWNWQLRKQVSIKTAELLKGTSEKLKAEERLELAIEAAGLGVWEWDVPSSQVFYNAKWFHLIGYEDIKSPQNIKEWDLLVHPEDKLRCYKADQELLLSEMSSNVITFRVKTSKGSWKWLLSLRKTVDYDASGSPTKIYGIHLDIDSLKRRELELQETTKELLKTNVELQKFASITSHNLRAPIVNLISLTEMDAEEDLPIDLKIEIKEKIRHCVKQLNNTLTDLIEIVSSKSEEKLHREILYFQSSLTDIMSRIDTQVKACGALIETDFSEAATVYFTKNYLESILINLLTNSINYRSKERRLVIHVKTQVNKDFTVLTFSDNGSGIDLERFKNKIFGLYQRFHPHIDGKGLGLYIVKSQIESMDGKIEVSSVENEGTAFRIFFHNNRHIDEHS